MIVYDFTNLNIIYSYKIIDFYYTDCIHFIMFGLLLYSKSMYVHMYIQFQNKMCIIFCFFYFLLGIKCNKLLIVFCGTEIIKTCTLYRNFLF